jgi:hypothetical protein
MIDIMCKVFYYSPACCKFGLMNDHKVKCP